MLQVLDAQAGHIDAEKRVECLNRKLVLGHKAGETPQHLVGLGGSDPVESFARVVYLSRCNVRPRPTHHNFEFLDRKNKLAQLAVGPLAMTVQHHVHCERVTILAGAVVRHVEPQLTLAYDAMHGAVATATLDLRPVCHARKVVLIAQA